MNSYIDRAVLKEHLWPGIMFFFGLEYKDYEPQWNQFFETVSTSKAYEEWVGEYGTGLAPLKAPGEAIALDSAGETWKGRVVIDTYALSYAITREAIEDNQYGELSAKYTKALKRSMVITKEIRAAAYMEGQFTVEQTGDGVSVYSASHPLKNGNTVSNLGVAADLNETSLEAACLAIGDFVDQRGLPIRAMPMSMTVPNEQRFVAERIFSATSRPGTNTNDPYALKAQGFFPQGFRVNNYLTDPKKCHIKTDVPNGPAYFDRRSLDIGEIDGSEVQIMRVYATERYAFAARDPLGQYGMP